MLCFTANISINILDISTAADPEKSTRAFLLERDTLSVGIIARDGFRSDFGLGSAGYPVFPRSLKEGGPYISGVGAASMRLEFQRLHVAHMR
jgi:hypothetical protein